MIVQEAGMAVGWPLGLGHDTTGWPLGLRLRLTQEDLQWPREPPLDDSPSYSTTSSSLDTESTRSFFQDKSISLGTLIGLPINQYSAANNHDSHAQRRNRRNTSMLRVFPTSTSSGSRCSSDHHHHHHHHYWRSGSKSRSSGRHSSHGSNRTPSKSSTSAGWLFLSVLSCSKVPSGKEAGRRSSKKKSSSSSLSSASKSGSRGVTELSTSNAPDIPNPSNSSPPAGTIPFTGRTNSPASKLYDNITFEEEAADNEDSKSSVWNPLFASSSLADEDDDLEEHDPDAVTEPVEHLRQSLMRSHSSYSTSSKASDWSSASESFDRRKSPSSNHDHELSQFGKQSAIHLLLSRMVCCRSTPTIDS